MVLVILDTCRQVFSVYCIYCVFYPTKRKKCKNSVSYVSNVFFMFSLSRIKLIQDLIFWISLLIEIATFVFSIDTANKDNIKSY